jgi:hypothetical protein
VQSTLQKTSSSRTQVRNSIFQQEREEEVDQGICGKGNGSSQVIGGRRRGGSGQRARMSRKYGTEKIGHWPNKNVLSRNDGGN